MIVVRSLKPTDSVDVLRINALAEAEVYQLDWGELSRLMDTSPLHLVAVQADGSVVGYALAFSREHGYDAEEFLALRSSVEQPFVYVDQIAVECQSRGTGVGRILYEELASRARCYGVTVLCCDVNISPPNSNSLAFHRHMGFRQVGEIGTTDGRMVALFKRDVEA